MYTFITTEHTEIAEKIFNTTFAIKKISVVSVDFVVNLIKRIRSVV